MTSIPTMTAEQIEQLALSKYCSPHGKANPETYAYIDGYTARMLVEPPSGQGKGLEWVTWQLEEKDEQSGKISPKFGDIIINHWAGKRNPLKRGFVIMVKRRTIQFTDCKGNFWDVMNDNESRYQIIGNALESSPVTSPGGVAELYNKMGEWSKKVFPDAGSVEHLKKLQQEAKESAEAPDDLIEYADCFLCLIAAAYKQGFTFDQFMQAAFEKFAIVQTREWNKQPDGTYQHKPPPPTQGAYGAEQEAEALYPYPEGGFQCITDDKRAAYLAGHTSRQAEVDGLKDKLKIAEEALQNIFNHTSGKSYLWASEALNKINQL